MKLFIDIVMKRIYLFNIVAWNYRKKIGFPVCLKENFAGLQAHRKRRKSARASPTPHHTLNEERSARFTAQPLSALIRPGSESSDEASRHKVQFFKGVVHSSGSKNFFLIYLKYRLLKIGKAVRQKKDQCFSSLGLSFFITNFIIYII